MSLEGEIMVQTIRTYFKFAELKTNFKTEIVAGISTYLSLAYILVLNPTILGHAGMDSSAILFGQSVASRVPRIDAASTGNARGEDKSLPAHNHRVAGSIGHHAVCLEVSD